MECVCIEQYQDIKEGMTFDIVEIYQDYYVLDSDKGWTVEVSNEYFNKCFKVLR